MKVIFKERDFIRDLGPLPLAWTVDRYTNSVIGGPLAAQLSAKIIDESKVLALWDLLEYARRPVEIWTDQGDMVWWGFVAQVELRFGNFRMTVSIDSMYNSIAVAYTTVPTGANTTGERRTTAYGEDAVSIAEYGRRQQLVTVNSATDAHAIYARDSELAIKRFPAVTYSVEDSPAKVPSAQLVCRGWWSTLDWFYYSAAAASLDTALQVEAIADADPFFTDILVDVGTSGLVTDQFRDGDGKASFEIGELLRMGTSNTRRMLASVDAARIVRISEEPVFSTAAASNAHMDKSGQLSDRFGNPLRNATCPVGMWVLAKDVIPASVDLSYLNNPTWFFVEESTYTPATGRLKFKPRAVEKSYELGRPKDG